MSSDTEFNLLKLKLVDDRTRYLLSGFVREIENSFTLTIPELILVICTFYYYPFESLIKENCGPDILLDGNCAEYKQGRWNTVYGNIIIDGNKFPNALYKWTLKPLKIGSDIINIGISTNFSEMMDNPYNNFEYNSYGISRKGDIKKGKKWDMQRNENIRFQAADIIRMEVNVAQSVISFYKLDSKMVEIKIENIQTSKFKLAICLSQCAVELMDFQFALDNSINKQLTLHLL